MQSIYHLLYDAKRAEAGMISHSDTISDRQDIHDTGYNL